VAGLNRPGLKVRQPNLCRDRKTHSNRTQSRQTRSRRPVIGELGAWRGGGADGATG